MVRPLAWCAPLFRFKSAQPHPITSQMPAYAWPARGDVVPLTVIRPTGFSPRAFGLALSACALAGTVALRASDSGGHTT